MATLTPRADRNEVNFLFNSGMEIWQRDVTITSQAGADVNYYVADRWSHRFQCGGGTIDNTMQRFEDAPANTPFRYSARIASGGAANPTGITSNSFRQTLEKSDTRQLIRSGKIALSFYYKSTLTGTHVVGMDIQGFNGTNPAAQTFTVNSANTWEKYEFTFDVSSKANNDNGTSGEADAGLILNIGPYTFGMGQTTWAAGETAFLTGVMLNSGSRNADWSRKGIDFADELSLCQRYYEKSYELNTPVATNTSNGRWKHMHHNNSVANDWRYGKIMFTVRKRTNPTISTWSGLGTPTQGSNFGPGNDLGANSAQPLPSGDSSFNARNSTGGVLALNQQQIAFHWAADAEFS